MTKINFRAFNEDNYKYAPRLELMSTAMPEKRRTSMFFSKAYRKVMDKAMKFK